jgi:hypothetical protein
MGAKIQAFDIFQTPLSSHYPLPLIIQFSFSWAALNMVHFFICKTFNRLNRVGKDVQYARNCLLGPYSEHFILENRGKEDSLLVMTITFSYTYLLFYYKAPF